MRKVFADTSYWVAVTLPKDQWHSIAQTARTALGEVKLISTQEVLTEFLNMMSSRGTVLRDRSTRVVQEMHQNLNLIVVPQSNGSFHRGLARYQARADKDYSLTDCISMNVMDDEGIRDVLTNDHHFGQEGYNVLMKSLAT